MDARYASNRRRYQDHHQRGGLHGTPYLRRHAGVRERLAISTAQYNGCQYCLSAHTFIGGKVAKVDAAELEHARHAQSSDPHIAALLSLSNSIAREHGNVDESVLRSARNAGVTEAEIGEVVGHLAVNVLTNYFNVLARVENDWPVVDLRQQAD